MCLIKYLRFCFEYSLNHFHRKFITREYTYKPVLSCFGTSACCFCCSYINLPHWVWLGKQPAIDLGKVKKSEDGGFRFFMAAVTKCHRLSMNKESSGGREVLNEEECLVHACSLLRRGCSHCILTCRREQASFLWLLMQKC